MRTFSSPNIPTLVEGGPWGLLTHVWHAPQVRLLATALLVALGAALAVQVLRCVLHGRERRRWLAGSRYIAIAAPGVVTENGGAVFWDHLSVIARPAWRRFWFGQPWVLWELHADRRNFTVRVWVPSCIDAALVEGAIEAACPGASTTVVEAEPPLRVQPSMKGERLAWPKGTDVPVVVSPAGVDPMRPLLHAVGVGVCPASRRAMSRMSKAAWSHGQSGGSSMLKGFANDLLDLVQPGPAAKSTPSRTQPEAAWVTRKRKILQERVSTGSLWSASVRWAVSMPEGRSVRLKREAASTAAAVSMLTGGVSALRRRLARPERQVNSWALGRTVMVNTPEVAALAHLPFDEIVPALDRARARRVRPVEAVPSGGRGVKPLGRAAQGGRKVGLHTADARQHLHVLGSTGTGKSTLLQHMILSDIKNRRGTMVIDPKGDLINDLLDRLDPETVRGRLTLIDPAEPGGHGFLPLSGPDGEIAVDHVVGICNQLWERHWGPRATYVLRNGLRTVLAAELDLIDLPGLMMKPDYWREVVKRLGPGDEQLLGFWVWWEDMDKTSRYQAIGPILSRFDALFGNEFMRSTFGKPAKPVDIGRALDTGGIVFARLPKGEMTESAVPLMGSVLVAKAAQAAMRRSHLPDHQRPESVLYLDEAHNFLNLPQRIEELLTEARAMRMGLVLAH
ncbi:type IV secretory system conjugative DNA transfer family protein [Glycomyces albidus]|uniref:DUF87 domain-containing protein n=1 Tax=Glycomyces albidus TaxID=2656774 RepID=A0A6L5G4R9_9ACTN|nr:DUF87 domain-containing protein [Glycomyces albidus]MQM24631.1 DUF87 domain-containing protein [Glycomyces albidus]